MPVTTAGAVIDMAECNVYQAPPFITSHQFQHSTASFISLPILWKRRRNKQKQAPLKTFRTTNLCPCKRFICTSYQAKNNNNIDPYSSNNNGEDDINAFPNDPSKLYDSLRGNVSERVQRTLSMADANNHDFKNSDESNSKDDDDDDINNTKNVKGLLKDVSNRAKSSMIATIVPTEKKESVDMEEEEESLDLYALINVASLRSKAILKGVYDSDDNMVMDDDCNDKDDIDNNDGNINIQFSSDEMITSILQRATKTLDLTQRDNILETNTNESNTNDNFEMMKRNNDMNKNQAKHRKGGANKPFQQDLTNLLNTISTRAKSNLANSSLQNVDYNDTCLVDIAAQRAMTTINVEYNITSGDSTMDAMTNRANAVVGQKENLEWVKWDDDDDDWKKNDLWDKDEWDKDDW